MENKFNREELLKKFAENPNSLTDNEKEYLFLSALDLYGPEFFVKKAAELNGLKSRKSENEN